METSGFDPLPPEKPRTALKNRQVQKIATVLLRFIEICVLVTFVSRSSTELTIAVKNCCQCIRELYLNLSSPHLVFLLGNAIVVTLFVKSRQLSAQNSMRKQNECEIYGDFLRNLEQNQRSGLDDLQEQRKQRENLERDDCEEEEEEEVCRILKRSAAENCRRNVRSNAKEKRILYPEDQMSTAEFRRTVEAFIARKQRFLMEEEHSGVVH